MTKPSTEQRKTMHLNLRSKQLRIDNILAISLVFNSFSSFLFNATIIQNYAIIQKTDNLPSIAYLASLSVACIAGSFFRRANKRRFIRAWLIQGTIISCIPALPVTWPSSSFLFIALLQGVSLGIGVPTCLSYFADSVPVENRGKIGGLIFFATALSAPILLLAGAGDPSLGFLALAAWRGWCLPLTHFGSNEPSKFDLPLKEGSFRGIIKNRQFILYFSAWLMFILVDSFGSSIVSDYLNAQTLLRFVEPIIASVAALAGGIMSDRIGRKRVILFGFASLGIGYATVSLTSSTLVPPSSLSWLLFVIVDGVAAGSLWVIFTIVLWGELSPIGKEKCYALGGSPYFLSGILAIVLEPLTHSIEVSASLIFSIAAFFLFVAVLPLMYAEETLPEKKMRDRELKIYIENAQKVKQKYA